MTATMNTAQRPATSFADRQFGFVAFVSMSVLAVFFGVNIFFASDAEVAGYWWGWGASFFGVSVLSFSSHIAGKIFSPRR